MSNRFIIITVIVINVTSQFVMGNYKKKNNARTTACRNDPVGLYLSSSYREFSTNYYDYNFHSSYYYSHHIIGVMSNLSFFFFFLWHTAATTTPFRSWHILDYNTITLLLCSSDKLATTFWHVYVLLLLFFFFFL